MYTVLQKYTRTATITYVYTVTNTCSSHCINQGQYISFRWTGNAVLYIALAKYLKSSSRPELNSEISGYTVNMAPC